MNRRQFLLSSMGPAIVSARPSSRTRITRVTLAPIQGRFHKYVAMNSYDRAPKGHTYTNTLVRIATNEAVEGVGVMAYAQPSDKVLDDLRALIGADPMSLYVEEDGRLTSRRPEHAPLLSKILHLDGPLFDLIGKLKKQPCWRLLGQPVRDRVEVYDGTFYFSDIWFRDRGVRAVVEEAEEAVRKGYRGMKFKVGRGWEWMDEKVGLERDVAVMRAVRKAVGPEPKILADANNGYRNSRENGWRFLNETADVDLYFIEEPFPEDVEHYQWLRERMHQAGMKTLIADGEGVRAPGHFRRFLSPKRLIDVLQMDIRQGGFLANLEVAAMGKKAGAQTIPHNWGSRTGLLMGLHFAKAVENAAGAEDDRSTYDVIADEGYEFRNGYYTVSDAPGLGIRVDEKAYETKCKAAETVVA